MLAVTALAPACGGKDVTTTTAATEAQTDTTPATGTTHAPTTSAGTTGAGTTGAELPDCNLHDDDPVGCSSLPACLYLGDETTGECILRCQNFTDQATCEMQELCYWLDGCYLAV